jgi:thioredoxin 1
MDDELAEIRAQKRAEIADRVGDEDESTGAESPDEPVHVESSQQFQELTAGDGVVLVDFHADWCGPCKMLEPVVATIAAETEATVAKVDVDAHQQLAAQFQVRGVPTIVLFADGEPVERFSGVRGEEELRALVQQYA